jgi:hypothetical protein
MQIVPDVSSYQISHQRVGGEKIELLESFFSQLQQISYSLTTSAGRAIAAWV